MQELSARVVELAQLADYQDGSVVSRTIMDDKAGTVTFFAFDKGQALSEHTTPFDALVYVVDGKMEILISGKPFHLKAGQMVIMPANEPHAVTATERFKMVLTMMRT